MASHGAFLLGLSLALFANSALATEHASNSSRYSVGSSEVVPPAGVPLGAYRRITHPFRNWTLICDENLQRLEKICNVSQTIVDTRGRSVFSWTLAAAESGAPLLILRSPDGMLGDRITIGLGAASQEISVTMDCDQNTCVGLLRVDDFIQAAIGAGQTADVTYTSRQGAVVSLKAPLEGLADALAAIN